MEVTLHSGPKHTLDDVIKMALFCGGIDPSESHEWSINNFTVDQLTQNGVREAEFEIVENLIEEQK